MNESLTDDERHLVLAAYDLGLLRTSNWPDVAAQLLVRGLEGEAIAELAGLSRNESPWVVDQLVPAAMSELGAQDLSPDDAGRLVGRAVARAALRRGNADGFAAVRALAKLSPALDYPGGTIGEAYYAEEWLDCECHKGSQERAGAAALEAALRTEPLDVGIEFLDAVTRGWV